MSGIKKMYDNISPMGSSEMFADKIIARAEKKSLTAVYAKPVRFAAPVLGGCAIAVAVAMGGMWLLGNQGDVPVESEQTTTSSAIMTTTPPPVDYTQSPVEQTQADLKEQTNFELCLDGARVWEFPADTPVLMGNNTGHGNDHELYRPIRFTLSASGFVIDYVAAIPCEYWYGQERADNAILSEEFMISGRDYYMFDFSFSWSDGLGEWGSGRLGNNNTVNEQWNFSGALNFTVKSAERIGDMFRETVMFHRLIDIDNLEHMSIGSADINLKFDYAFDTRKPVEPVGLSSRDRQIYDIISTLNRPINWTLQQRLPDREIHYEEYPEFSEDGWAWLLYTINDVKEVHDYYYAKGYGFNPADYGVVWFDKYVAPHWSGGSWGLNTIFVDNRTNSDGTVTMTVVTGVAPNHGDVRIVAEYGEVEMLYDENGMHIGNRQLTPDVVLGFRCPFYGELFYYPEVVAKQPKIEYTFIMEDGKWKILSVNKV
jgi:hypothetical protein